MLLIPVVVGAAAYAYSKNQEVLYEASATLLVQQRRPDMTPGIDFSVSQQLASTYRRQVNSSTFLERIDTSLTVDDLQEMMSAKTESLPAAIEIRFRHPDPNLARDVTSIIAKEFVTYVLEQQLADIARTQTAAAASGIQNVQNLVAAQANAIDSVSLLEPVDLPKTPVFPRTQQNVLLGLIIGIIGASTIVLLLGTLGDTLGNPDEIERRFGIKPLGAIFKWSDDELEAGSLALLNSPTSGYSEAFRQVRANFQFATATNPGRVFLVTSPGPEDGKSTVISNLAIAMAQNGSKVLLLDGDLRRPSLHRLFQLKTKEPGLSNYLAGQFEDFGEVIQPTGAEGVDLVPGGIVPPNPSELLGSQKMSDLLESATDIADYVLVDSPPVLMVADSSLLASKVDGVILVMDGPKTRPSSLRASIETLTVTKVNTLGIVVNKLRRSRLGSTYGYTDYYDYYYYRYYSKTESGEKSPGRMGPLYTRPISWTKALLSLLGLNFSKKRRSRSK